MKKQKAEWNGMKPNTQITEGETERVQCEMHLARTNSQRPEFTYTKSTARECPSYYWHSTADNAMLVCVNALCSWNVWIDECMWGRGNECRNRNWVHWIVDAKEKFGPSTLSRVRHRSLFSTKIAHIMSTARRWASRANAMESWNCNHSDGGRMGTGRRRRQLRQKFRRQ